MKMTKVHKEFASYKDAKFYMAMKNSSAKAAKNFKDIIVIMDGPEDNYVAMDLVSAIETELPYEISYEY